MQLLDESPAPSTSRRAKDKQGWACSAAWSVRPWGASLNSHWLEVQPTHCGPPTAHCPLPTGPEAHALAAGSGTSKKLMSKHSRSSKDVRSRSLLSTGHLQTLHPCFAPRHHDARHSSRLRVTPFTSPALNPPTALLVPPSTAARHGIHTAINNSDCDGKRCCCGRRPARCVLAPPPLNTPPPPLTRFFSSLCRLL